MFISALFDPMSILVLVFVLLMTLVSFVWYRTGQAHLDKVTGGLMTLRYISSHLNIGHPIRKRLESAPVSDLAFEEIAKLMTGNATEPHALGLVHLRDKLSWIERFSQYSVHLGILGTVFALVSSDPTDLESFRAKLPLALGTTFWGLIGALMLSTIAGMAESLLERASGHVRHVLLSTFDDPNDAPKTKKTKTAKNAESAKGSESAKTPNPTVLDSPDGDDTLLESAEKGA